MRRRSTRGSIVQGLVPTIRHTMKPGGVGIGTCSISGSTSASGLGGIGDGLVHRVPARRELGADICQVGSVSR